MILISIGHHAQAKGASFGDFNEYDEATIWAKFIVSMLGDEGVLVPTGILAAKVKFINGTTQGTCAAEIHFNSAVDSAGKNVGRGCETLYAPGSMRGKKLAECVQKELAQVMPPDRGVKEGWYRMSREFGPDFFLVKTKCPSIIIEPEFIHHVDLIKNNREEGCYAITKGLLAFKEEGKL